MLKINDLTLLLENQDGETFDQYLEAAYGLRIIKTTTNTEVGTSPKNQRKAKQMITIIDMNNKQFIYPETKKIVSYGEHKK